MMQVNDDYLLSVDFSVPMPTGSAHASKAVKRWSGGDHR